MKLLLYSGLLYLTGIAIILYIRPSLMFTSQGIWKEFGINRKSEYYTWLPFWLFVFVWAIISYTIIILLASMNILPGITNITDTKVDLLEIDKQTQLQTTQIIQNKQTKQPKIKKSTELQPGYYILDQSETQKKGMPKYIFLGAEVPNVVYNDGETLTDMEE